MQQTDKRKIKLYFHKVCWNIQQAEALVVHKTGPGTATVKVSSEVTLSFSGDHAHEIAVEEGSTANKTAWYFKHKIYFSLSAKTHN